MEFATGYSSPMDSGNSGYVGLGSKDIIRDVITEVADDLPGIPETFDYARQTIPGTGVGDIGMSLPMGIAAGNIRGIAAKMRTGVANLEIQFPGTGRGNRQSQTPELYGKLDRQALWELAKVNKVNLTTHASFGISGLSGQDPNSGNFNQEYRKVAIDEVKRAIEFAVDTADGGSVVVHTGEFQRPISEQEWADGGKSFRGYNDEPERATLRVVDWRTGQVLSQVRKNQIVYRPDWVTNEKERYQDSNGHWVEKGDFIDYENNKVMPGDDELYRRVPKFDKETGRFKVTPWTFDRFKEEAAKLNKGKTRDQWKTPEEMFIRASIESQYGQSKGWALYHANRFEGSKQNLEKLKETKAFYENLKEKLTPEKWDELKRTGVQGMVPPGQDPVEYLNRSIFSTRHDIENIRQGSVGYEQSAEESRLLLRYAQPIEKYALEKSVAGYAEAAMHAYNLTKEKKLKKPVFIALENIFPESYGSHPQELKSLIFKAREGMAKLLVEQKKVGNMEQAMKIAENHVKATFDTGHVNTWRKYFQAKSGETVEKTNDRFKTWLLDQTEDLAKSKIIGNIHLADNMGYQDDHLAPGQGTTPVKEMIAILKKHGYSGALTVEPGADATTDMSDFHGLMKTWRYFGSQVHGMTLGSPAKGDMFWKNVQNSYFRYMERPYFVFGNYAPSNDWTLWSGVPLE
ncbi:MAG: TIM barrel protein [Nanoarchaeota archaeon]|nr:TIM barrel protein [Nanoarchaeota archaeon]